MAKNYPALFLALLLSLFFAIDVVVSYRSQQQRTSEARQCRIRRLVGSRPSRRIECEGGIVEIWDSKEAQLQCVGVAAMRQIIQPKFLVIPNFSPQSQLIYIHRGQGLVGISYHGCAETFQSTGQPKGDEHQKIHRVRQGDVVALPAGVTHWLYNDGNEEVIALSVTDLNSPSNQLDQTPTFSFLAGGQQRGSQFSKQQREIKFGNIMPAFDADVMAEALNNIPIDLVRRMQREDERGFIVKVGGGEMGMVRLYGEQEQEQEEIECMDQQDGKANGLEETVCNDRINHYLDDPVDSKGAGTLNSVTMYRLPILRFFDMRAEKGKLNPNAMLAPHRSINAHKIIFITGGEGRLAVVNNQGRTMFDDTVREGELIVVPQYFASMKRAGNSGLEWVTFKTSACPMRRPLVGKTSVFHGIPLQVLANSYRVSMEQARDLKFNRHGRMMLSPLTITHTS